MYTTSYPSTGLVEGGREEARVGGGLPGLTRSKWVRRRRRREGGREQGWEEAHLAQPGARRVGGEGEREGEREKRGG